MCSCIRKKYIYMHVRVIYVNIIYRYIERETPHETYIYIYILICLYMYVLYFLDYIYVYISYSLFFYLFSFFAANPAAMMSLSQQIVFFKRSFGFLIYILYF